MKFPLLWAHSWKNVFGHHLAKSTIAHTEKNLPDTHAPFIGVARGGQRGHAPQNV